MLIADCQEAVQMCCNMRPFLKILRLVISIIQWSVPMLLIVLGTIDMFKAVANPDEKVIKDARTSFMKRLLYGVIIFLVPFFVRLILNIVSDNIIKDNNELTSATAWIKCWTNSDNDSEMNAYCSNCKDIYESEDTK